MGTFCTRDLTVIPISVGLSILVKGGNNTRYSLPSNAGNYTDPLMNTDSKFHDNNGDEYAVC